MSCLSHKAWKSRRFGSAFRTGGNLDVGPGWKCAPCARAQHMHEVQNEDEEDDEDEDVI